MSCDFAHDDAAYVLGALSPTERVAFERHLATCDACARSVQELAGLPGLLARVAPEILESPPVREPVPDTLLPSLVQQVRRTQQRRVWLSAGLAAAAAVVVVLGVLGVVGILGDDETPTAEAPPAGQAMVPVEGNEWDVMTADLALTSVGWGTKLDLTCSYDSSDEEWEPTYVMYVHTRDGETEQVATWKGLAGKTMHLAAATATERADIASVEVQTADGTPLLELREE